MKFRFRFAIKRIAPEPFFFVRNSVLKNNWDVPLKLSWQCSFLLGEIEKNSNDRLEIEALHDRQLAIIIVLVILYVIILLWVMEWL